MKTINGIKLTRAQLENNLKTLINTTGCPIEEVSKMVKDNLEHLRNYQGDSKKNRW